MGGLQDLLPWLAKHTDTVVRRGVAGNLRCPPEVLSELATDREDTVRLMVAENPYSPPNIMALLAADSYLPTVRTAAANRNCPQRTTEQTSRTSDQDVRRGVAYNWRTPSKP